MRAGDSQNGAGKLFILHELLTVAPPAVKQKKGQKSLLTEMQFWRIGKISGQKRIKSETKIHGNGPWLPLWRAGKMKRPTLAKRASWRDFRPVEKP